MWAPIVVHWYGPCDPYNIDKSFGRKGIYILTGKRKYQRNTEVLYCGITESKINTYIKRHPQLENIFSEQKAWVGNIVHPNPLKRSHLEHAEWLIVYYTQLSLNEKKRESSPREPGILISHWFKPDGSPRINQPYPIRILPDVIC
jgi:hypothetical protein